MRKPAEPRALVRRVVAVLAWTVAALLMVVLLVAVGIPRVAGATPYTVLTGSMRPGLPPGTLVVVRPVDPGTIRAGDVITYQLESGRPEVVTHRVVGTGVDMGGDRVLLTQGDANTAPDPAPVRDVQVRGRLWYAVPVLGRVEAIGSPQQHRLLTVAIGVGLILWAVWLVGVDVVSRRRRHPSEVEEVGAGASTS